MTQKALKQRVLDELGVTLHHENLGVQVLKQEPAKTASMLLIESRMDTDIQDLLMNGPVRKVARALGISYSTVSRWRKLFGIPSDY